MHNTEFQIGDEVTGNPATTAPEDLERGTVLAAYNGNVTVAWGSIVRTTQPAETLALAEERDDLDRAQSLIAHHPTHYAAAQAINAAAEARGLEYRITPWTVQRIAEQGQGKPALLALVCLVLDNLDQSL